MAILERVLLGIGGIIDILYPNWSISIFNASLNYAIAAAQSIRETTHDSLPDFGFQPYFFNSIILLSDLK